MRRAVQKPNVVGTCFAEFDGFFMEQLDAPGDVARVLHHALTRSIHFCTPEQATRRPSMCHDGTPVVYSVKLGTGVADGYRVLVEPGSLQHSVAQQVALSLTIADRIFHQLGWQAAVPVINTVAHCVFAGQAAVVDRWWGGIWLGACIPLCRRDRSELRLYLNLRNGPAADRWRRVRDVFSRLSSSGGSALLSEWADAMVPGATPVGLAIVVSDGRVRGLRVYTVVYRDALARLVFAAKAAHSHDTLLQRFCADFDMRFGSAKTMTVGTDFRLSDKGLQPCVPRIKVDLCCQLIAADQRPGVLRWVDDELAALRIDASPLRRFADRLRARWGHFDVEFVGLALQGDVPQVTVYVKPAF